LRIMVKTVTYLPTQDIRLIMSLAKKLSLANIFNLKQKDIIMENIPYDSNKRALCI
jgi:hypothetical protein